MEGHRVTCTRFDLGGRISHRDCTAFERRMLKHGEGFCEHLVLAIECAIDEGRITPTAE
jgi:hypothetical protein